MGNQRFISMRKDVNKLVIQEGRKVERFIIVDVSSMGWHELRRYAKDAGIAIHGLNREDLELKIKEVNAGE